MYFEASIQLGWRLPAIMKSRFSPLCKLTFLFGWLLTCAFQGQAQVHALFVGNSYTGYNNLAQLTQSIATSKGKVLTIDAHHPGGNTLGNHLNNATVIAKIGQATRGYVVLQEQSQIPVIPFYRDNSMYPAARGLDSLIRAQDCVQPVFYMTWGREFGGQQCDNNQTHCSPNFTDFEHMQDSLETAYLRIANELNATVSPVGIAWKLALDAYPTLDLWTADNSHPTIHGSYLAACTMFATFFLESPVGASFPSGITSQQAQTLQQAAADAVLPDLLTWNADTTFWHIDANFSSTSSFLTHNFTNLSVGQDSVVWDFGDGSTSNDLNPVHTFPAEGKYQVCLTVFGPCGQDSICDSVTTQEPLSMGQEISWKQSISVFPNPANSRLYLSLGSRVSGPLELELMDLGGKTVWKAAMPGNTASQDHPGWDISMLAKGTYLLRVWNLQTQEQTSLRLVITH